MSEYKYMVEFAHQNDQVDEDHPLHHGRGRIEITVPRPIVSQQDKDDVAATIGRTMNEDAGKVVVTTIAIAVLEPVVAPGEVVIDYDPASELSEETKQRLSEYIDDPVYDITSLGKKQ